MTSAEPLRLAVLISGGGTTMTNIHEHICRGQLNARIVRVIASSPAAGGIEKARVRDLPVDVLNPRDYQNTDQFSAEIWQSIRNAQAQLVVLGGFLTLLPIAPDYRHKVMNIHPALLPAFGGHGMYGKRVHEAVLAHGCKVSGCTVHFADDSYDQGPIILQRTCPVMENDTPATLAARVFEQECIAYPQAIDLFHNNRLTIDGRRTRIAPQV